MPHAAHRQTPDIPPPTTAPNSNDGFLGNTTEMKFDRRNKPASSHSHHTTLAR
jgi:hypothetical protein